MQFYIDPASNVAQPILDTSSDSSQLVSFGIKNEKLVLISDVDDSVVPPAHQPRTASNWHTCTTDLDGVIASAMGWVIGPAGTEPQNPTCSIAEIRRVYV